MKRFITAILTLALTTALSADKASAQQANPVPNLALSVIQTGESGMDGIAGSLGYNEISSTILGFAATETGVMAPDDCPNLHHTFVDFIWALWQDCNDYDVAKDAFRPYIEGTPHALPHLYYPDLGGQEGEDLVDLWFELVDAGYTEDEAFEMIEMLMGEERTQWEEPTGHILW